MCFSGEEAGGVRIMVTFEGPGKVGEGGQAHGAHSHNYPGTKKKKTKQKAIMIPPSAEQQ